MENQTELNSNEKSIRSIIEKIVLVFLLSYGISSLGDFVRDQYKVLIKALDLREDIDHALGYGGHICSLILFLLYALAVKGDRKYILSFRDGSFSRNFKLALLGALSGFGLMGICIFGAWSSGTISISPSFSLSIPMLLVSFFFVFLQSSTEEIESRGFVFGKMSQEGVPVALACIVSSFYFSFLHAHNTGFNIIPAVSIFMAGLLFVLGYYYFKTIWFSFMLHTTWNFTQDFIFGLPDSGHPAAASIFSSTIKGSGFFYDEVFGIEGSFMAILSMMVVCILFVVIGRKFKKD